MNRPADPPAHRRLLGIAAVVFFVAWASAAVAFLVGPEHHSAVAAVVAGLPIAVAAVVGVAVVPVLRRRGVRWLQPSPLQAVDEYEKKRIMHAIRHDEPFPPDVDHGVAQAMVERVAQSPRWLLVHVPAAIVLLLGLIALLPNLGLLWRGVAVVTMLIWGWFVWQNFSLIRRSRRRSPHDQRGKGTG